MRLGIVGSRRRNTFKDKNKLRSLLIKAKELHKDLCLVSGGCSKGADRFAEELSVELNIPIIIHYPDKSKLPENYQNFHYAQIAYERNTLIAQDCDVLIALVAPDRKGGTEDTIKKTLKLEKKVILL